MLNSELVIAEDFPTFHSILCEKKCLFEKLGWIVHAHVKSSHSQCSGPNCDDFNKRMDFHRDSVKLYLKHVKQLCDKITLRITFENNMNDKDGFVYVQLEELKTMQNKMNKLLNYVKTNLTQTLNQNVLHNDSSTKLSQNIESNTKVTDTAEEQMHTIDPHKIYDWHKSIFTRFGWIVVLCNDVEFLSHYLSEICILKHCYKKMGKCTKDLNSICIYVKYKINMVSESLHNTSQEIQKGGSSLNETRKYYKNLYLTTRDSKYKLKYKNM